MKRPFLLLSAALVFAGSATFAITADDLIADYRAQGYTRIEVKTGVTQVKVEAIRGAEKLEVIYDAATGAVLKTEVGAVGLLENTAPGVTVRNRSKDFLKSGSDDSDDNDGDDDDDDSNDHDGDDDDDDTDDDSNDHDDDDDDDDDHDDDDHDDDDNDGTSGKGRDD